MSGSRSGYIPPEYSPSQGYMEAYISSEPITSSGFVYQNGEKDDRSEMETNIEKITNAVVLSRGKLAFSNDDLIEENTLNVGPQPNLETLIHQKLEIVQKVINETGRDNVPRSVYAKLKRVIDIAKDGNASTFTASSTMEAITDAFDYGRTAANNQFDLKRESKKCLQQFDDTFLSMIQSQIEIDLDKAETEMNHCFHLLGDAVTASRIDKTQLLERQTVENQLVDMPKLEEIHTTSGGELQGEEIEYAEIEKKCKADMSSIDYSLQELTGTLSSTIGTYHNREKERSDKLTMNRASQEELRKRLRQLEAEEREYLRVEKEEEEMMETAQNDYSRAEAELIELKEKIALLGRQATASLRILEVMKDCTDEVLVDAKKRKTEWEEKLKTFEVESLLITRDVLVATICLHKMEADDCTRNMDDTVKTIDRMKAERQDAARRRFKERADELTLSMAKNEETKDSYSEKLAKHRSKIQETSDELASVTGRIKSLDSGISLPNIDTIYRERCRIKEDCFKKESIEDAKMKLHSNFH